MDAFISHVEEIKEKGFDTILFCISETDLLYNIEIYQEFRVYAESEGLATWATFWGYSAGEAICKECDFKKWCFAVQSIGFGNAMIDEPKTTLDVWVIFAGMYEDDGLDIDFHLCLSDSTFNKMSDEEIIQMPVKSVGLSCYHLGHKNWAKVTDRTIKWCTRLKELRPDDNFVFLQAFEIHEGMEDLPMIVKDIAEDCGIEDFGVWSFKSTAATGTKRPKNHKQIWDKIKF